MSMLIVLASAGLSQSYIAACVCILVYTPLSLAWAYLGMALNPPSHPSPQASGTVEHSVRGYGFPPEAMFLEISTKGDVRGQQTTLCGFTGSPRSLGRKWSVCSHHWI